MGKPTKILTAEEFDKLFNDKERFIRIAYSYINDMEMATDITTDGFMYLWEHREHLDFDVNIKGYIYNYVKTRCISHLRKRKSMLKVNFIKRNNGGSNRASIHYPTKNRSANCSNPK